MALPELKKVLPVTARTNEQGHLHIGGCDTVELAHRFDTPLFVFCEETFRTKAREFKQAFPEARIFYAAKAFLSLSMCRLAAEEGLGLDVASRAELHTSLTAGFAPQQMIHHGNNKSDAELTDSVQAGVGRIVVDSLDELRRLSAIASRAGRTQKILLRVTPGIEAHTHTYIQTGQEDTKFGFAISGDLAMQAVREATGAPGIDLVGVHCHIGSQIFSIEPFVKTIEIVFEFLAGVRDIAGARLSEVNLGGGIGIAYIEQDSPLDLSVFSHQLQEAIEQECSQRSLPVPQLSFEPGRFLVGNAMVTLYRVGTIKQIPGGRTYISVDGGMSDNIRPALYGASYSGLIANKANSAPDLVATIAGLHCESDLLIKDLGVPAGTQRDDILAIGATGAYGYSMASNYNRQPRPAVVAVRAGSARLMIRRETHEDLLRLDVGEGISDPQ